MALINLVCWNIQRLNHEKADTYKADIVTKLLPFFQADACICFILENKHYAEETLKMLADEFESKGLLFPPDVNWIEMGGEGHRRENLLVLSQGVELSLSRDSSWHSSWDVDVEKSRTELLAQETQRVESLKKARKLRDTTFGQSMGLIREFEDLPVMDASHFRDPIVCTYTIRSEALNGVNKQRQVACLHAPGPSDKSKYAGDHALLYFDHVMRALDKQQVAIVMGDFNVYGSVDHVYGFSDKSAMIGGTTRGTGQSRLDRVYVRNSTIGLPGLFKIFQPEFQSEPDVQGNVEKFAEDTSEKVSDHLGVVFKVTACADYTPSLAPLMMTPPKKPSGELFQVTKELAALKGDNPKPKKGLSKKPLTLKGNLKKETALFGQILASTDENRLPGPDGFKKMKFDETDS